MTAPIVCFTYEDAYYDDKDCPEAEEVVWKSQTEDREKRPVKKKCPQKKQEEPQLSIIHLIKLSFRPSYYQLKHVGRRSSK
jgi:hypothetical protein